MVIKDRSRRWEGRWKKGRVPFLREKGRHEELRTRVDAASFQLATYVL